MMEGYRCVLEENGTVTEFLYHGGMLLNEQKEENTTAKSYVPGREYLGYTATEGTNHYYITDEQGSIRHVLKESGEAEAYYQYDAFGETITTEGITSRLKYNAQAEDELSGLYYLRARYYNPAIGRFTQEDVIYNDGLNLYAYCNSNPVVYCDPSGLAATNPSVGPTCDEKTGAENAGGESNISTTESPALKDSPYNPNVVEQRTKPNYVPNPAHDSSSSLYNPKKTPEPSDARTVYNNSVRGGMGEWYGVNDSGEIYQFFYDRNSGVHFAGIISNQDLARKNSSVIELLGISMKGKR